MTLRFTKMQGAGNDFVVLDATRAPLALSAAQLRALGDRRFGVGADQILVVERSEVPGIDFRYRIFNGSSATRWNIAVTVRAVLCATCATTA